jgi:hypothetical protein
LRIATWVTAPDAAELSAVTTASRAEGAAFLEGDPVVDAAPMAAAKLNAIPMIFISPPSFTTSSRNSCLRRGKVGELQQSVDERSCT